MVHTLKNLLKKTIRPFYFLAINAKTRASLVFSAKIAKRFLPKAYQDELAFFEDIRSQTYKDAEYLSKRIRMRTHQVDKTLTLNKKVNKAVTARQVEAMIPAMHQDRESDRITCQWVNEVLGHYNKPQQDGEAGTTPQVRAPDTLFDIIKTRRSVRSYKSQKIENDVLVRILEAGLWAPSGCNRQPVEYLVVDDAEDVLFCQKYAGEPSVFPREAAVNIVVLIDPRAYALPHQRHMAYLEGGAAIQNILLSAHALGLGACWMFWEKHDQEFNKEFNLSPWFLPVGLLCVGHSDRQPPIVPKRKCVLDCIHDMRKKDKDFGKAQR